MMHSRPGLAASAALLALAASGIASSANAQANDSNVPCYGVNACKGQSDCKTARNGCAGQNSCKGEGYKEMSKEQCAKVGGSLTEPK